MIPQTVPNSPMNGAMLAVVARNGHALLELVHFDDRARSSARSTAVRLLRVGRPAGASRIGPSAASGVRLAQLGGQFGVAGLKQADERTVAERAADRLHFGELVAAAEDVEELRRMCRCGARNVHSL